jgi:hypothetical protein
MNMNMGASSVGPIGSLLGVGLPSMSVPQLMSQPAAGGGATGSGSDMEMVGGAVYGAALSNRAGPQSPAQT